MELVYFPNTISSGYSRQVRELLKLADREFIPPLSARGSSTQADLSAAQALEAGVDAYFETMQTQPVVLAIEEDTCLGFMAFKENYTCSEIGADTLPNLYASTCVVHPEGRGQGLMQCFYEKMLELFPKNNICTRTWHTNFAHLRVLEKLGFSQIARLKDHRGPGMDTVYFLKTR